MISLLALPENPPSHDESRVFSILMELIPKDIPVLHNPKAGLGDRPLLPSLNSKIIEGTILLLVPIITL